MAVLREFNFLGQMRVDSVHLRTLESGVAGDFDVLVGRAMAGSKPLVVRGLKLSNAVINGNATSIQLSVADSILFNVNASESGSFFWASSATASEILNPVTNSKIVGGWSSGAVNYVGLDLYRSADSTTADLVQFRDIGTAAETPKTVPLARTLSYKIYISTTPFSAQPNIVPIAKVTLGGSNVISAVEDARSMFFRLGAGGDVPNQFSSLAFAEGRNEYSTIAPMSSLSKFDGGDKGLRSMKDWMDAVMTRIWEIGGGEHWYSGTADRNINMIWTGTAFSNGQNFEFVGGHVHWRDLVIMFDNSNSFYNVVQNQLVNDVSPAQKTLLADGDCVYVDLNRAVNGATIIGQKATLASMGSGIPAGSRYIIAWRYNGSIYTRNTQYAIGTTFTPATISATGVVKLNELPNTPSTPVVVALGIGNGINVGNGSYTISGTINAITSVGGAVTGASDAGAGGLFTGGTAVNGIAGPGLKGVGGAASGTGIGGVGLFGQGTLGTATSLGLYGYGVWGKGADNSLYTSSNNPASFLAEASVGGLFVGGGGTIGGDGVVGMGRGTATPRAGVVGYGNSPSAGVSISGGTGVAGIGGTGGSTNGSGGTGVTGTGGARTGTGTDGYGGYFDGGNTASNSGGGGVYGTSTYSYGVTGNGSSKAGVYGISSSSDGVYGTVATGSSGVYGENTSSGYGVKGSSSTGTGVYGQSLTNSSTGWGVLGVGRAIGVYGTGTASGGRGVVAEKGGIGNGSTVEAPFRIVPQSGTPANPLQGDMYFNSTTGKLVCYTGSSWTVVGPP